MPPILTPKGFIAWRRVLLLKRSFLIFAGNDLRENFITTRSCVGLGVLKKRLNGQLNWESESF